jgi:hypothetical protein
MTPPTPTLPNPSREPVAARLARIAFAPQQSREALALWPLVLRENLPRPDEPGYVLLSSAHGCEGSAR